MRSNLLLFQAALCLVSARGFAQTGGNAPVPVAVIREIRGDGVTVSRQPNVWDPAHTNQALFDGNMVRTDERSQALLRFSDLETVRMPERSTLRIHGQAQRKRGFDLLKGLIYFFHRDKPDLFEVSTPQMSAIIRGTEFTLEVGEDGTSTLSLVEGDVAINSQGVELILNSGEKGIVEPGQPPRKTALVEADNVIQWCLYYPGVLNLEELSLSEQERAALRESLAAYRQGDLVAALTTYPKDRQPGSNEERVYRAALLLAFGDVRSAEGELNAIRAAGAPSAATGALADALRTLIAAARGDARPTVAGESWRYASSLLADSYLLQSRSELPNALSAARKAVQLAPSFSFAWARIGELEFSFGNTRPASEAVEKSLQLAPRNAQAHALRGFLFAARNRVHDSLAAFDQAIAIDPMLANGWLGHGLCQVKQGKAEAGRQDLQMAATVEPNRALLRSYLGKAFSNAGDNTRAGNELDRAKTLDPRDPTAWLYSALVNEQNNRINEGVRDLERSLDLNENRRVYRSTLSLDEDRAVRAANLARIYRDAGMFDWSVREASRAVNSDYANSSAHLFLANSYNELRDPNLINLRYETATFSEYLVANLLSPVGATPLSPYVSQQEYSRLLERDGIGISSDTLYSTHGDWQQEGSVYGTFRNFGYALDAGYRSQRGYRPNSDLELRVFSGQFKVQLTPQDSVYLQAILSDSTSGDVRQLYNFDGALTNVPGPSFGLRVHEEQEPNLFAGYHHEWSPGIHTLFLGGRLNDQFTLTEPKAGIQTVFRDTNGMPVTTLEAFCPTCIPFSVEYQSDFDAYTAELQQLFQTPRQTLVVGGRYQIGEIDTKSLLDRSNRGAFPPIYDLPTEQQTTADLERTSIYAYEYWRLFDPLWLTVGISYDRLEYPRNIDLPPISFEQIHKDQLSPKVGLQWQPWASMTLRGAYTRSLGGLFYDASVRLEPTQIAGFNQAYRSLIPESVEGSIAGSEFETFGLGLDYKLKSRTYVTVQAELLRSEATRTVGAYDYVQGVPGARATTAGFNQELDFEEKSLAISASQLLADEWSLGARYKVSEARLNSHFQEISTVIPDTSNRAVLHELNLFAIYTHSSGFFAEAQSLWVAQSNFGYTPDIPGDNFWQFNLLTGYRFARRHGEVSVGILNLSDQNYRLNPLNLYSELPRERTAVVRLRFNF